MDNFKISEVRQGRPKQVSDPRELDCYNLLDKLQIEYQRVDYNFYPTNADDQSLITKALQTPDIKNLFLNDKHHHHYFLVIMDKDEKFDQKKFRHDFHLGKITMSSPERLKEVLNSHPGAVSVSELMYDDDNQVKVYIQKAILEAKYFRFHPNENHATVRIQTTDLVHKFLPALHHQLNIWDS